MDKKIIESTRELARVLQENEIYKKYKDALDKNYANKQLQQKIQEYDMKRAAYDYAVKQKTSEEHLKPLEKEINSLYKKISESKTMKSYENARKDMDELMNGIVSMLQQACAGYDPEIIEPGAVGETEKQKQ